MKISVIINNYNYERFLPDTIDSVLNQSLVPDEIILVDDASTDSSLAVVEERFSHIANLKLVPKEKNEGQLDSFNQGYLASTGDLIFFLDSDDLYHEQYIEEAVCFYETHEQCDFLFCAYEHIGDGIGGAPEVVPPYEGERNLGYSVALTFATKSWLGSPTSTLSMRRDVLDKILPIPFLEDWQIRADDCLVWGASLAGARKYFMPKALVQYRIHDSNRFYTSGKKGAFDITDVYKRGLYIERLFSFLRQRLGYGSDLQDLAHIEFQTIPSPTWKEFTAYTKVLMLSDVPLLKRVKRFGTIFRYYKAHRRG